MTAQLVVTIIGLAAVAQSQTVTAAPPAFEVASVKHSPPQPEYGVFTVTFDDHRPGQIHYANMSLKSLLTSVSSRGLSDRRSGLADHRKV